MKVYPTFGSLFQSISLIPGIDISWYYGTTFITVCFIFWTVSLVIEKE